MADVLVKVIIFPEGHLITGVLLVEQLLLEVLKVAGDVFDRFEQ